MTVIPDVVFPDAASLISAWLAGALPGQGITAPVGLRIPNPRPQRYVVVVRTGGVQDTSVTEAAQLTFNCYGPDDAAASTLAQTSRALIRRMVGVDQGQGVMLYNYAEVQGPMYLPSPDTVQPRYVFTARLTFRGSPL